MVHVRSKDGAEGISGQPPRGEYLHPIFQQLVIPISSARTPATWKSICSGIYRYQDNYKLHGLALWCPVGVGRVRRAGHAGAHRGQAHGRAARRHRAAARCRSTWPADGATPRPSRKSNICKTLVERPGAKAVKFRVGGRMSRNADAMPGRTETLIPLVAQDASATRIDIHADANSSYDPPKAIEMGRMLEDDQGRLLRGAVPVRPPGRHQDRGRRADDSRGGRRAGVQRVALPLDDRQPRRATSCSRTCTTTAA